MICFDGGGDILNHIIKGQGADVIFLHGWGGSIASFKGAFDVFSQKYRCTVLDFYGFGESKLPSALELNDYADAVNEIIQFYNMKDVILVGHSFGGRVAMLLASRTDNIKSIVLVDSAGLKPRCSIKKSVRKLNFKLRKLLKMDVSECGSPDYRALSGDMRQTFKNVVNFYLDDCLKDIKCDCLIIWGKKDKDTPPYMAKRLKRGIYNSGLIFLQGGHYCYLDCYKTFLAILDSYLNSVCK